jgi:hypothetical protein
MHHLRSSQRFSTRTSLRLCLATTTPAHSRLPGGCSHGVASPRAHSGSAIPHSSPLVHPGGMTTNGIGSVRLSVAMAEIPHRLKCRRRSASVGVRSSRSSRPQRDGTWARLYLTLTYVRFILPVLLFTHLNNRTRTTRLNQLRKSMLTCPARTTHCRCMSLQGSSPTRFRTAHRDKYQTSQCYGGTRERSGSDWPVHGAEAHGCRGTTTQSNSSKYKRRSAATIMYNTSSTFAYEYFHGFTSPGSSQDPGPGRVAAGLAEHPHDIGSFRGLRGLPVRVPWFLGLVTARSERYKDQW